MNYWMEPALAPRPFSPAKGDEGYWQQRNKLVDAVRAARSSEDSDAYHGKQMARQVGDPEPAFTAAELAARDRYNAALEDLRRFDAAHGGAPVL